MRPARASASGGTVVSDCHRLRLKLLSFLLSLLTQHIRRVQFGAEEMVKKGGVQAFLQAGLEKAVPWLGRIHTTLGIRDSLVTCPRSPRFCWPGTLPGPSRGMGRHGCAQMLVGGLT